MACAQTDRRRQRRPLGNRNRENETREIKNSNFFCSEISQDVFWIWMCESGSGRVLVMGRPCYRVSGPYGVFRKINLMIWIIARTNFILF